MTTLISTPAHGAASNNAPAKRWRTLDALRGFAIAGILFVNAVDITHAGIAKYGSHDTTREALDYTVQGRFYPLFVFLFGMSMWFTCSSALRRETSTWLSLLLRMITILAFGGLLWIFYPGNILLEYGIVGLIMIPFAVLSPAWLNLTLGLILTAIGFGMFGGGIAAMPGLILLGQAAAHWRWPARFETPNRAMAIFTVAAVVLSIPAILWQTTTPGDPRFSTPGGIAGGVMAAAYLGLFAVICWTPARTAVLAVFEPMGKMALSNYFGAAVIVWAIAKFINFENQSLLPLMLIVIAILAVQSIISRIWLNHFRYGPLEWVWRMATWREIVPMRK